MFEGECMNKGVAILCVQVCLLVCLFRLKYEFLFPFFPYMCLG